MHFLSNQSPSCRSNALNLIIVGVIFGSLWIAGTIMQVISFKSLGNSLSAAVNDPKKVVATPGDTLMSAIDAARVFTIGSLLATIGFLALVIGMPILGAARHKMSCDR
jgi:glucose uptake protein GlcU